jgi:hypothetical protein
MGQLYPQHGSLKRIHSHVVAGKNVLVRPNLAPVPQEPHPFSEMAIVGHNGATLAESTQRLGRIETERTGVAYCAHASSFETSAMRLRRVLDQTEPMGLGEVAQRRKGGRPPM